jgi:hypothetical protein
MKRMSVLIIIINVLFAVAAYASAEESRPEAPRRSPRLVATALDHLTVLEYDEPVAQAAVGSSVFQIERQDNKIFIKPLKTNASTNLFVWTTSNQQFSYELSVGEVTNMDTEIHIVNSRPTPAPDARVKELEHVADMAVSRTLLGIQPVDSSGIKAPKGGVAFRLEEVFSDKTTLFIRYSLENHTSKPYRIGAPTLHEMRIDNPTLSLASLKDKQLDQHMMKKLGDAKEVAIPGVQDSGQSEDIAPGARKCGIITVHQSVDLALPTVVEVVFTENLKAAVVL